MVHDASAKTVTAFVKDVNGSMRQKVEFGGNFQPTDTVVFPDMNNNSSPELGVLGKNSFGGGIRIEIRDSLTGGFIRNIWYSKEKTPLAAALVSDLSGDGFPELATLLEGSLLAQLKDPLTPQFIGNIPFNPDFKMRDFLPLPDIDNMGSPKLVLLGVNQRGGYRTVIRDVATNSKVTKFWHGHVHRFKQLALLPDMNNNQAPELAALIESEGSASVQINDALISDLINQVDFTSEFKPKKLVVVPDVNANGTAELAVLGRNPDTGDINAEVRDAKTKELLRNVVFDENYPAQDMIVIPDINGNNASELVVIGKHLGDKLLRAFIKDAKTGELIRTVDY